jgi:hypothetical protein
MIGGDAIGPELVELGLELGDEVVCELLLGAAAAVGVEVRGRQVVDRVVDVVEAGDAVAGLAPDRDGGEGRAVVGVDPADDVTTVGLTAGVPVELDRAVGDVDRGRAPGRQVHVVQVARRQLGELLAQETGRDVGHVDERVGVGELSHLLGDGIGHLVATESDVRAPHPADGVEVATAVAVDQLGTGTSGDRQDVVGEVGVERLVRVEEVASVAFDDLARRARRCAGRHGGHPPIVAGGGCRTLRPWRRRTSSASRSRWKPRGGRSRSPARTRCCSRSSA